ncbi:hypothetical protein [Sphingomonas sp.]|uniref:hypothetical protein n=1 Tax=Sphingomonas sp. TaxID=28214 RepID=UPI0025F7CE3A|nr:hypothetical protein [Sphingomonas sp.]
MCIELRSIRIESYNHAMAQVRGLVGRASIWDADLQLLPSVRALAFAGRLDRLESLLNAAKVLASRAGLTAAAEALRAKEAELQALGAELAAFQTPSADVVVLSEDWGKRGRGAKIMAWIVATGATADQVAARYQLARSTAQRYIRRCQLPMARIAA